MRRIEGKRRDERKNVAQVMLAQLSSFGGGELGPVQDADVVFGQQPAGQRAVGQLLGVQAFHRLHHAFEAGRAVDHQHPHALLGADLVWHARGDVDAGALLGVEHLLAELEFAGAVDHVANLE